MINYIIVISRTALFVLILLMTVFAQDKTSKILVNHVGFLPHSAKFCIAEDTVHKKFHIINTVSKNTAYNGQMQIQSGDFGTYLIGDFSKFADSGTFMIKTESAMSYPFHISENIYRRAMEKSIDYFAKQRCGNSKTGYHAPCHLDDGIRLDTKSHQDVTGGWHDACDLRKWIDATIYGIIGLARMAGSEKFNKKKIMEEIKWGNQYFLKMQVSPGYIGNYCGGDDGNRWTDNKVGTNDDRPIHIEPAPTTAQFLFIRAQTITARIFHKTEPVYAQKCQKAALNCMKYCIKKNITKTTLEVSTALSACIELSRLTNNRKYLNMAANYAKTILKAQAERPVDESTYLYGFFYNSENGQIPFTSISHGCLPLISLCELVEYAPNHPEAPSWRQSISLFCHQYITSMCAKSVFGIAPFGLFIGKNPGGNRRIGSLYYRYFMNTDQWWWVGINANLASTGIGLVMASRILDDPKLKAIAQRQLDWILGVNPFNASTVTGVGKNQPALFVATEFIPPTPPIPGGVMNGIGGTQDDRPALLPGSWHTCEYWTPMVCHFLRLLNQIQM
jgi:hypothetical protein